MWLDVAAAAAAECAVPSLPSSQSGDSNQNSPSADTGPAGVFINSFLHVTELSPVLSLEDGVSVTDDA